MRKVLGFIALFLTVFATSCSKPEATPSKVWLHRANDIGKARCFQDKYAGLEVDVYFDNTLNTFLVKHYPDEEPLCNLDEWFSSIDEREHLGFWIDFKNLDYSNVEAAAKEMARLRKTHKLKGMIIVESSSAGCLKAFDDLNFRTSYYIPYLYPSEAENEKIQKVTDSIRDNIKQHDLKTISGSFFQYQYMKDSFPDMRKLIWYEMYDTTERNGYIRLVNEDEKTDVILVAVVDSIDYSLFR